MTQATFSQALATLRAHPASHTPDIAKCFKANSKFSFDEKCFNAGASFGVDWSVILALPQKQVMRCIQFVNSVHSEKYDGLDYTHARILCAMKLAGDYDLTTDAIIALAGASRSDAINTRGVSYSALNRMFARKHGLTTIQAKMSNSTGKNGIFQALGMTFGAPGEINHTVSLNDAHPLSVAFFALITKATDGQIASMQGADKV